MVKMANFLFVMGILTEFLKMKNNLLKILSALKKKKKRSRIEGQDSWPGETEERRCGVEENGRESVVGEGKRGGRARGTE